jgi:hypothetical protein
MTDELRRVSVVLFATRVELEVHDDASWDPFAKICGLAE